MSTSPTDLADLTASLLLGDHLSGADVAAAAEALLDESIEVEPKADFLKALADKGETPSEIATFVENFLGRAVDPLLTPGDVDFPLIDVCGTGGDKLDLFNVSTTAMFVIAGAGVGMVKHGNRSITSKSGGADVLEALGVAIDLPPARFATAIREIGVAFLFAPQYHPAFKAVGPVRALLAKEGRRTVFNILGPLLNPVRPDYQVIGVFDQTLPPIFADILRQLGRKGALVVHGKTADGRGVDELSTMGPTSVARLRNETITESVISPADLGLNLAEVETLQGGGGIENAAILRAILDGSDTGPRRDIVCLNAAAAFVACERAADLAEGLALAGESIENGQALDKLEALIALSG